MLDTINVLEINGRIIDLYPLGDGLVSSLWSFPSTKEGSAEAEALFRAICKKSTDLTDDDIIDCIDRGYADVPGGATIQLVNSTEHQSRCT